MYNGVYRKDLTFSDKMQIYTLGKAQKIEQEIDTMFIRVCVHALSQSLTHIYTGVCIIICVHWSTTDS